MNNVLACDRILSWLIFDLDGITPCCEKPHNGELNISRYDHIDYQDIIDRKINLIQQINKNESHICRSCYRIREYDNINKDMFDIDIISLTFDKTCNIRCSYCYTANDKIRKALVRPKEYRQKIRDKISDILQLLPPGKLTAVGWTGGEPFLMEDFDAFYAKIAALRANSLCLYSNLTTFKDIVVPQTASPSIKIMCSLDCGTEETYKKIKKQPFFNNVIENIRKYCEINSDTIFVKYIFCDHNISIDEIDQFFILMKQIGVKNVILGLDDYLHELPSNQYKESILYFAQKAITMGFHAGNVIRLNIPELDSIIVKSNSITV